LIRPHGLQKRQSLAWRKTSWNLLTRESEIISPPLLGQTGTPAAELLLGIHILEDLGLPRALLGASTQGREARAEWMLPTRLYEVRWRIARRVGLVPVAALVMLVILWVTFRNVAEALSRSVALTGPPALISSRRFPGLLCADPFRGARQCFLASLAILTVLLRWWPLKRKEADDRQGRGAVFGRPGGSLVGDRSHASAATKA
jgi:hypothetical protein